MTGTIRFDSNPLNAEVYINNKLIGQTPLDITDVEPGNYLYIISHNNQQYSNKLTVHNNKITHISVDLTTDNKTEEYLDIDNSNHKKSQVESMPENQQPDNQQPNQQQDTQQPSQTEHATLEKHLSKMNEILEMNNKLLSKLSESIEQLNTHNARTSGYDISYRYFNQGLTAIRVATPNIPGSPDIIADPNTTPPTPGYDRVLVHDTLQRNSPNITVSNEGLTNLFVISSPNGTDWSTSENTILRGEYKRFFNVYELRIRSAQAGSIPGTFGESFTSLISGIPTGGVYRVTEYTTEHYTRNINRTSFNTLTFSPLLNGGINSMSVATGTNIFNLPVVIRASPTNTDNIFIAAEDQNLIDTSQRFTLAPGDAVSLFIMDGTIIIILTFADGQGIEMIYERDLTI